eukprot:scaffold17356_cov67-Skeletonema_dohrnii-CCMP3373.AAC.1
MAVLPVTGESQFFEFAGVNQWSNQFNRLLSPHGHGEFQFFYLAGVHQWSNQFNRMFFPHWGVSVLRVCWSCSLRHGGVSVLRACWSKSVVKSIQSAVLPVMGESQFFYLAGVNQWSNQFNRLLQINIFGCSLLHGGVSVLLSCWSQPVFKSTSSAVLSFTGESSKPVSNPIQSAVLPVTGESQVSVLLSCWNKPVFKSTSSAVLSSTEESQFFYLAGVNQSSTQLIWLFSQS